MKRFPTRPWMTPNEIVAIASRLKPHMRMVEYGSGGSTLFFAPMVAAFGSIEHDAGWFRRLMEVLPEHVGCSGVDARLVETRVPAFHGKEYPPGYVQAFQPYVDELLGFEQPDVVLVDGRSRRAAARLAMRRLKPGGLLFVHDYACPTRTRYHEFISGLLPELTVDSLAVFQAPQIQSF